MAGSNTSMASRTSRLWPPVRLPSSEVVPSSSPPPSRRTKFRVYPGEDRTLFVDTSVPRQIRVFSLVHDLRKAEGVRAKSLKESVSTSAGRDQPVRQAILLCQRVCRLLSQHLRSEASFLARSGGLKSEALAGEARRQFDHWKSSLAMMRTHGVQSPTQRSSNGRLVDKHLTRGLEDGSAAGEPDQIAALTILRAIHRTGRPTEGDDFGGRNCPRCRTTQRHLCPWRR